MAERPLQNIKIREFPGLVSNRGPFVGKPGETTVQINVRSVRPGILEVRGGLRELKFSD